MQLASQCLRHLNRARLFPCQPYRGLDGTLQVASSPTRTSRSAPWVLRAPFQLSSADIRLGLSAPVQTTSDAEAAAVAALSGHRTFQGEVHQRLKKDRVIAEIDRQVDNTPDDDRWKTRQGLADFPENKNDASAWFSLLDAAKRRYGRDGVLAIWDAVEERGMLCNAGNHGAVAFWNEILEAVLDDESRLQRVVLYAEWMFSAQTVRWPSLYATIVSYCLRNGQHRRALKWHLRLMPNFDPGPDAFGTFLQELVADSNVRLQETLKSLYLTTLHRSTYDKIIPFLYHSGLSRLCGDWRRLLIRSCDLPRSSAASQPYLRFLTRYYPGTPLELEERKVADLDVPTNWSAKHDTLWDAMAESYSKGFGEEDVEGGRRYSDALGARWFASSWVPLEFAIHAIHALGIHQIGPLSLQSIALRESTPEAVTRRIEQLHKVKIGLGHSTYARAVRHFAGSGNAEMLHELLHTDIHPEVFDDFAMQQSIRDQAFETGDWKTYRLLLAIQPAVAQESIESTSNILLQQRLEHHQTRQALALMDDMKSMNIEVSVASVQQIYSSVLEPLLLKPKVESAPWVGLQMAVAYLNRLLLLRKPVPWRCWQQVLFSLGKMGRFVDLEKMCLGLLDAHSRCTSQGGLFPVNPSDAPPCGTRGLAEDISIPADLPISHDYHPMRRVFGSRVLQVAIVRWGFKAGLAKDLSRLRTDNAPTFAVTQGVQLLAKLRKHGIPLEINSVRKEVLRCLSLLQNSSTCKARNGGRTPPNLAVVKRQIDKAVAQATGRPLLPDIFSLGEWVAYNEEGRERRRCRKASYPSRE
ncbi:pentatricopeptide repeat domain-containing protein [Colletotrichum sojae]|uniref:Pentatricopeptide repeat domain-containing protein n=1 Tax=Colletotrichum sojae TaxID=2175907 RepID=A0A8H6JIS7_9PEZI|nr:pentatricopeptide repeat domain-containing protein [Colletotrichum sojae]